jgi:hypothetical protein
MMFFLFPIAVIAAVAVYLGHIRAAAHRRNAQSWDSLMAQLRLDWSARELSDGTEGMSTTPESAWQRMEGPKGLCVMYQNAKVMLEMADYAARSSESVDRQLLETLRSDAMHIRVYAAIALGQYAFRQLNESICVNAYRAASMYVEMADRMTELLQVHNAGLVPDFSAAM